MATQKSTTVTTAAAALVAKYPEVCAPAVQTLLSEFLTKNIYEVTKNNEKKCGYTPFPKEEWQSFENLSLPKPLVDSKKTKKVKKVVTEKVDGKTVRKTTDELVDKPIRLKKITTVNAAGKNAMVGVIVSMLHEAYLTVDRLQKEKIVSPDAIKAAIIDTSDSQEWGVSPLVFALNDNIGDAVVAQQLPVTHQALDLKLQEKFNHYIQYPSLGLVVAQALVKFFKLYSIFLANNLWHECKEAKEEGEEEGKEGKEGKEEKKKGGKKKKPAPKKPADDDEEADLVGVSKTTTGKQLRQFMHSMQDLLLPEDEQVKLKGLFEYMTQFEKAYTKADLERKANNKADREKKAQDKKEKEGKEGKKPIPADAMQVFPEGEKAKPAEKDKKDAPPKEEKKEEAPKAADAPELPTKRRRANAKIV